MHGGICQLKGFFELCMFSKVGGMFGESMRFGSSIFHNPTFSRVFGLVIESQKKAALPDLAQVGYNQ